MVSRCFGAIFLSLEAKMSLNLQSLPCVYALLLVDIAENWHVKPEELLGELGLTREMLLNHNDVFL
jgi:hypothetical protein